MDAERILFGLNSEQRRAVEAVRGPVCILAGAGSGKTTTITRRIANQVATGTFAPGEILAVTFTDKAAGEMRSRLAVLGADGVQARTFHSAALAQLRYFAPSAAGRILPSKALTLDLEGRLRATRPLTPRKADRMHTLNLTGEMTGYIWSINNVAWNKDVPPLPLAKGERVELVLVNRTPMPHPMHLHGHEFQVVEIDGKRFPGAVRDTVLVTPGRRVVVAFDANNPGFWAFHCHLLYHLDAGMFTTFRYL